MYRSPWSPSASRTSPRAVPVRPGPSPRWTWGKSPGGGRGTGGSASPCPHTALRVRYARDFYLCVLAVYFFSSYFYFIFFYFSFICYYVDDFYSCVPTVYCFFLFFTLYFLLFATLQIDVFNFFTYGGILSPLPRVCYYSENFIPNGIFSENFFLDANV